MKKDIVTLNELEKEDFVCLFDLALELKKREKMGVLDTFMAGRILGLIFDKHSTRTRVSFEAAMHKMGGSSIYMSPRDMQVARAEPVKDTARVLSRYIDALAIRTYSQELIEEYARYSGIPVINALSDKYHPCQVLSDILTIIEKKGGYEGVRIAWVGDGNNVAHSWIMAAAALDLDLVLGCPEGYMPDEDVLEAAKKRSGKQVYVTNDPFEAVSGADVIYTDVWASMGQEDEHSQRLAVFKPFQVNQALLDAASDDVIVMHCLPAHRGEEITDDILEGPHSVVWDQAENKMHIHKAVLKSLILDNR